MTQIRKLPTGVPGFDILSAGGIPAGRSTLVSGRSGTGKTILGLQVASHLVRQGIKTIILAVEESPEDLLTCGDALGFDLTGASREGGLRVSDATRPMEGPTIVSGDYDMSGLLHRVEGLVRQTGAEALVLDSATALFSPRPPHELLRSLFFQLVYGFRKLGLTAIILAEAAPDNDAITSLGVEDYVCDMVVIFRNILDGERRRRSIEINKYRRSTHYKGEYPCTITSRGLTIFPLDARDRADVPAEMERYSSGFQGLDSMIGGGLIRDSIAIVRGPTGSGKTLLAGLYARAGALRGERVAYWGFEEPRSVLLRNFAAIGMPMEDLENKGLLKVTCRYPEAMGLEDLLVQLRNRLEEFEPSLIVLDSISSIEHSLSERGFRQFMIGLASMLREHRRSALLTQTVLGGEAVEHTAPYLSTIADTILVLDYHANEAELRRSFRVMKMRGSAHETHACRLWIGQGGLRIEPDSVRAALPAPRRRLDGLLRELRVLLVEDFADAREATAEVLRAAGADVIAVASAQEALGVLREHTVDAIVCDIGLPEEDGYSLLRKVRALPSDTARIPAVALTGWGLPVDQQRAREAGFEIHLRKPVDPEQLWRAVARLAGRDTPGPPRSAGAKALHEGV